ncbi:MAG TPA: trypsin-like peptidase domain-containing protein, partial [Allosphingosinicella sp.]
DVDWIRLMLVRIDQTAAGAPDVDEPTVDEVKEAVVHQNDMLELSFLRSGLAAASSVAKLSVPQFQNGVQSVTGGGPVIHLGTGWIVAANLVMTNHHVINARRKGEAAAAQADFEAQALAATLTFDFDDPQVAGTVLSSEGLVAADVTLDFALIRVQAGARVALNCTRDLPTAPLGHGAAAINIIQHPSGGSKRVAIRNNLMASSNEQDLRYFTDTLSGSSGAPVFDDDWRVVALHRGHSLARGISFQGREAIYINVGTRISAILDHLLAHHQGQIPELHI